MGLPFRFESLWDVTDVEDVVMVVDVDGDFGAFAHPEVANLSVPDALSGC